MCIRVAVTACTLSVATLYPALASTVFFDTGNPNGLMAAASRPSSLGKSEIEAADDFLLAQTTAITGATFTGLLPSGTSPGDIGNVQIEIYRIFPKDSNTSHIPQVPTRVNSPSDVAFESRSAAAATLSFSSTVINTAFTAGNSVLDGIYPTPNQTTGGDGQVSGQEVKFDINFTSPLNLAADHYFFVPQVELSDGNFYWLSAPKPIAGGTGPFTPDLQGWIRNENLDPDWLRIGTDIVGGSAPPTFNFAFSLAGDVPVAATPVPGALPLFATAVGGLALLAWRSRKKLTT